MDIVNKVLEQDEENRYRFKEKPVKPFELFEKVIPDFFTERDPGLHVIIVCASSDTNVISEDAFGEIIKKIFPDSGLKFLSREKLSSHEPCGCIRLPMEGGAGCALQALEESIRNCTKEKRITDTTAQTEIERYAGQEEDGNEEPEIIWSSYAAKRSSKLLLTDMYYTPLIFALLVIPQKQFDLFMKEDVYFPDFIEYVVQGQDSDLIINILKKNSEIIQKLVQTPESELTLNTTLPIASEDRKFTEISQEKKELEKRKAVLVQRKKMSEEALAVPTKDLTAAEKARVIHKEEK